MLSRIVRQRRVKAAEEKLKYELHRRSMAQILMMSLINWMNLPDSQLWSSPVPGGRQTMF